MMNKCEECKTPSCNLFHCIEMPFCLGSLTLKVIGIRNLEYMEIRMLQISLKIFLLCFSSRQLM